MRNITQFFIMLTLSFYIAFAPAVAYADEVTDKIDKLQIDLQKKVGDKWTLSSRNKSVGAGVEIGVSQSYPVTATTTATTAAGATTTNTATLTAEKIGSKIFTPTTANVAKRFGMGVAQGLVAMALYDLLKKSVDYVMDPANNTVRYKADSTYYTADNTPTASTALQACKNYGAAYNMTASARIADHGDSYDFCVVSDGQSARSAYIYHNADEGTKTFEELAQRSKDIANNPNHKDNATAQSGMQTVVNDMITNNEIDNSYFNDADISNDTYNDVTNNYVTNNITNQYPSVSVPTQAEMSQAAANGQSSVTKTTQNANGTTTTTTTTFNTTNNTTNNTTTNNNTYNITNITVNNPVAQKDDSPASTPASTPTPTASTPTPTPNPQTKPFELPAFCNWAKPVCDFVDWVKKDPTDNGAEPVDVQDKKDPPFDLDTLALKPYISLPAECPANPAWNFMGGQIVLPLNIVCDGFSMASWLVMAFAWLRGLVIVGSTFKG